MLVATNMQRFSAERSTYAEQIAGLIELFNNPADDAEHLINLLETAH
jgi:hypothetical protein